MFNGSIVVADSSWLPTIGFCIFVFLGCCFCGWTISGIRGLLTIFRFRASTDEQAGLEKIKQMGVFYVFLRSTLAICSFLVAILFYLNSFVWFRGVESTDETIVFHYNPPKSPTKIERIHINNVRAVRSRNKRVYLVIETTSGKRFRSIQTDDHGVMNDMQAALRAR